MKFSTATHTDCKVGILVDEPYDKAFGPSKKEREKAGQLLLVDRLLGTGAVWEYAESGKPFFVGRNESLSFSHSENVYACQVSGHITCGIDVQHYRDKILRVAGKFLNPAELAFTAGITGDRAVRTLTAMWSCKEALFKMNGEAFIDYTHRFTVHPFEPVSGILSATADLGNGDRTYHFRVEFTDTFVLAFHTLSPTLPPNDNKRLFDI